MWRVTSDLYLGDYVAGRAALAGTVAPGAAPWAAVISLCDMPLDRGDDPIVLQGAVEWLHAPIADGGNGEGELERAIQVSRAFVARHAGRGPVLVHCAAGMSRSVSVLAALLCDRGARLSEALEQIAGAKAEALGLGNTAARQLIAPAWEFRSALRRMYGDAT